MTFEPLQIIPGALVFIVQPRIAASVLLNSHGVPPSKLTSTELRMVKLPPLGTYKHGFRVPELVILIESNVIECSLGVF
jgi:hypothetical protein